MRVSLEVESKKFAKINHDRCELERLAESYLERIGRF